MIREAVCRHWDGEILGGGLVFDAGAVKGDFTGVLLKLGHKVVAFEPDRAGSADLICMAHPNLTVVSKALAVETGTRKFYHYLDRNGANGFIRNKKEDALHPHKLIEVEALSLKDAIDQYGIPGLLKLNVEGAEVEIIMQTPAEVLRLIKQMTVSFHEFCGIVTHDQVVSCQERLRSLGFDLKLFERNPDCWAVRID